jgi:hypothetical protein
MAFWLSAVLWVVGAVVVVAVGVIVCRHVGQRGEGRLRRRLRAACRKAGIWLRAYKAPCVFVVVLALAALAGLAVWKLPAQRLASVRADLPRDKGLEYIQVENSIRTSVIQAIGGLVVLIGLYFTWQRIDLARQQQITEPYARAIEQLGSKSLEVRLAGIYALERIARDSEKDHWTIMEILTTFVRRTVPWVEPKPAEQLPLEERPERPEPGEPPSFRSDVQAALTVLGRRRREFEKDPSLRLDLHGTDLRRAYLERAHLEKAHLQGAHLEGAIMSSARLEGASLTYTHLQGADLVYARLDNADLGGADLSGARLIKASLQSARFYGAKLKDAELHDADLTDAWELSDEQIAEAQAEFAILPDYLKRSQDPGEETEREEASEENKVDEEEG